MGLYAFSLLYEAICVCVCVCRSLAFSELQQERQTPCPTILPEYQQLMMTI